MTLQDMINGLPPEKRAEIEREQAERQARFESHPY